MAQSLNYASPKAAPTKSAIARGVVMFLIVRSAGFWMFSMAKGAPEIFSDVETSAQFVGLWLVSPSAGFAAALWILRPRGYRGRPRVMGLAAGAALLSWAGSLLWPFLFWPALSPRNLQNQVALTLVCGEFLVGFLAGTLVLVAYRFWFDRRQS